MIETFLKENIFYNALEAVILKAKNPAIASRDSLAALGDIV